MTPCLRIAIAQQNLPAGLSELRSLLPSPAVPAALEVSPTLQIVLTWAIREVRRALLTGESASCVPALLQCAAPSSGKPWCLATFALRFLLVPPRRCRAGRQETLTAQCCILLLAHTSTHGGRRRLSGSSATWICSFDSGLGGIKHKSLSLLIYCTLAGM